MGNWAKWRITVSPNPKVLYNEKMQSQINLKVIREIVYLNTLHPITLT